MGAASQAIILCLDDYQDGEHDWNRWAGEKQPDEEAQCVKCGLLYAGLLFMMGFAVPQRGPKGSPVQLSYEEGLLRNVLQAFRYIRAVKGFQRALAEEDPLEAPQLPALADPRMESLLSGQVEGYAALPPPDVFGDVLVEVAERVITFGGVA